MVVQENLSNEEIKNLIYIIREKQVMLDSDVAMLYHYETKKINQVIKINIDKFIVIDNKEMYHLGASIRDLGKKCFGITKIEDLDIIEKVVNL